MLQEPIFGPKTRRIIITTINIKNQKLQIFKKKIGSQIYITIHLQTILRIKLTEFVFALNEHTKNIVGSEKSLEYFEFC